MLVFDFFKKNKIKNKNDNKQLSRFQLLHEYENTCRDALDTKKFGRCIMIHLNLES